MATSSIVITITYAFPSASAIADFAWLRTCTGRCCYLHLELSHGKLMQLWSRETNALLIANMFLWCGKTHAWSASLRCCFLFCFVCCCYPFLQIDSLLLLLDALSQWLCWPWRYQQWPRYLEQLRGMLCVLAQTENIDRHPSAKIPQEKRDSNESNPVSDVQSMGTPRMCKLDGMWFCIQQ